MIDSKKYLYLYITHPTLLSFFLSLKEFSKSIKIISTYRSFETQNELYSFGRTKKEKNIVTYAKGGESPHNWGMAIDISPLPDEKIIRDVLKKYPDIFWGKDFKKFNDSPHFEIINWADIIKQRKTILDSYV